MQRKYETVGIDLGTTYSTMGYIDPHGDPQVVKNPDDQRPIIPSTVFFDEEDVIVGEIALQNAHVYPEQVVQFAKRSIGEPKTFAFGKDEYTPETVSAIVLKKLLACAQPSIGEIKKAVITVPAFFNEKRRAATEHAGKIAGLEVMGTLNEPSAALIAYGMHTNTQERFYAVYDLGGGTFDVTVMRVGNQVIQELATGGNRELGGIDWDRALTDYVADEFVKAYGADPRDDPISYQTLSTDCRMAKQRLSDLRRTMIQCTHAGQVHRVEVTKEKFERLTRSLLSKTEMTVEACVRDAGLTWDKLDAVLLVGGSTRMPMIRNMLQRVTGKEPLHHIDPDLAVALGAAVYAGVIESRGHIEQKRVAKPEASEYEEFMLTEDDLVDSSPEDVKPPEDDEDDDDLVVVLNLVNPHGIGLFARNHGEKVNVVMIPKNSDLPVERSKLFRIAKDGMREISLTITEGDTDRREACETLGNCVLGPLPENLPKGSPIILHLGYDKDGRVHMSAECQTTGAKVHAEIHTEGILSDDAVEQERRQFAGLAVR